MVAKKVLPKGVTIRPVVGPALMTIDRSICKIVGVVSLTVEVYDCDNARQGIHPGEDEPRIPFPVSALVVDSLAYDVILGHDFLNHFELDIRYSESPTRIVGRWPPDKAPRIPWFTEHPVQAANLTSKFQVYASSARIPEYGGEPLNDSFDLSCPEYLPAGAGTTGYEGWDVYAYVLAPRRWPPPGFEDVDDLQDDPISDPLKFAVPDFTDDSVKLPDFCSSPSEEQRPVAELCEEFQDLFTVRPGYCDTMEHAINTGSRSPLCERVRPVPHRWREEVSALLKEMESLGVIRRSTSPWRFPCVFVPKKNGKVRMCIDYRGLNRLCDTEAYPVPRPDDVQEHLSSARYFTTLDLRSGYWQVPVRPEDQPKTAFCPGPGFPLYEWLRIIFGPCYVPETYGFYSWRPPLQEHLAHLRQVFEALRKFGLTIAAEKCSICRSSVDYLGHTFGPDGMTPDVKKVESIVRWPTPTSPTELRSFLGLANYYRGFLPDYSARTRPLYDLLNGGGKDKQSDLDVWTDIHEVAFMDVKESLARLPLLGYPDFTRPFQLIADASDVAIGAVLEQDGHPLSFFSQSLTKTQRRWPVYEREAYAIFRSLERFRNILLGYPLELVVFTDHKPLTFMETSTTPKVQRWMLSLCQYSFTVQYRPGKENVVADALSRIPSARSVESPAGNDDEGDEFFGPAAAVSVVPSPSVTSSARTTKGVPRGRVLIVSPLQRAQLLQEQRAEGSHRQVRRLAPTVDYSSDPLIDFDEDGLLVRKVHSNGRIYYVPVVPPRLRDAVLFETHENHGHQGLRRANQFLQERFYWSGMSEHLYGHIGCCSACYPDSSDGTPATLSSEADDVSALSAMMAMPVSSLPRSPPTSSSARSVISANLVTACEQWSKQELAQKQDEDDVLVIVKARLREEEPFSRRDIQNVDFRPYRRLWSVLFLDEEGLLVRMVKQLPEDDKAYVPVIPTALRHDVLYRFHDRGGHFGRNHVWDRMRRLCFWPGMNLDIAEYVSRCARCLTSKAKQKAPAFLVPFPVGKPWHTVAMDFLYIGPSDQGQTKLLVFVDHFTRWADAYVVAGEGASDALGPVLQVFSQFGPPSRILSDQGSAFESKVFTDALRIMGVAKARSTPHHPNSNGHVERFNATILGLLRSYTQRVGDWQEHLRAVLWQYNVTPHSSTGFSPYYLMYGREAPASTFPSLARYATLMYDPDGYAAYLARARAKIADLVDEWVTAGGAAQRKVAEQQQALLRYFVGQRVRMKIFHSNNTPGHKLLPKWQTDWYVVKFLPGVHNKTVVVQHYPDLREKVISTDYLLPDPAQPEQIPACLRIQRGPPPELEAPAVPMYPFDGVPSVAPPSITVPPATSAEAGGSSAVADDASVAATDGVSLSEALGEAFDPVGMAPPNAPLARNAQRPPGNVTYSVIMTAPRVPQVQSPSSPRSADQLRPEPPSSARQSVRSEDFQEPAEAPTPRPAPPSIRSDARASSPAQSLLSMPGSAPARMSVVASPEEARGSDESRFDSPLGSVEGADDVPADNSARSVGLSTPRTPPSSAGSQRPSEQSGIIEADVPDPLVQAEVPVPVVEAPQQEQPHESGPFAGRPLRTTRGVRL
ncbi:hypothetical protein FOZ63_031944 [Perkinsus olseni]|uniref:Integrase catalytic domain-containing protein n=1 Tax=Perkinsus olseni TaxID=32597 RepID=A0A7J6UMQ1_PEROL|nr:hypothetical protein FOZ63_031944 [Perkinsus olseni]